MEDNTSIISTIKAIYEIKNKMSDLKADIDKKVENLKSLETELGNLNSSLLTMMTENKIETFEVDDIEAGLFTKHGSSPVYQDAEIIKILKEAFESKYINVKTTEAIDKKALKSAMKLDEDLRTKISPYITTSSKSYVVVTDKENFAKMLEHMEE